MGNLPVPEWKITPHGAFGFVRTGPDQGSSGAGTYPSTHYGVDLVGHEGDPVAAPEDGTIVAVMANAPGDDVQPWRGYGPALVMLKGASGRFHLLAHLDPADVKRRWGVFADRDEVDPAKDVATSAKFVNVIVARETNHGTSDNKSAGSQEAPTVTAGQTVGVIGTAGHVHWEVRKSKLGQGYNPATWADTFVWHHKPPAEASDDVAAALKPEDSLVLVVLAIVALTFWPKGRNRK